MMKKNTLVLLAFGVVASCNFSDETRPLGSGWMFVDEGHSNKAIDGGNVHIPCEVLQYGYSDEFIIAAQKPTSDCFLGQDTAVYKEGKDKIYFWIFIHHSKTLLGPLSKAEFLEARK